MPKEKLRPPDADIKAAEPEKKSHKKRWLLLLLLLLLTGFIATTFLFTAKPQVVEIEGFYCLDSGSGYTIVGLTGNQNNQTLVIPETLGEKKVEKIADSAFKESGMKSFIVPSGIAKMGKNAFDGRGVFSIYMVGRKDLSGMELDESWSGVGEIIFQDVRPQINFSPEIKEVTEFTGDGSGDLGKDITLDSPNKLPDWNDPGEQLPDFTQENSFGLSGSGDSNGEDGSGGGRQAVLERIEIVASPNKTSYIQAETFNPAGMAVKAVYSDGFSQLVTGYTYSRDLLRLSETSIQISYSDSGVIATARVPITVTKRSPVKLIIKTPPKKTSYVEGTRFDSDGLVVQVGYNNAEVKAVTPKFNDTLLFLNQTGIELSYTEDGKQVTATQSITVEQKAPSKLRVKTPPSKLSYIEKESFDKTGMVLEITYNDGEVKETTDYTADKTKLTHTDIEVTLTHRYNGRTASVKQPIAVVKQLPVSILVTTQPDKTSYIEEEVFDPTGLTVTVKYDNGTEDILVPDFPKTELMFGQTEITLFYSENGKTVTINQAITVRKRLPVKLEVTVPPDKINYIEEELFNPSGMTVTASYDNGKSYTVTPAFTDTELTFGQTEVTLSFSENGKMVSVDQAVTVRKRLPVRLEVTAPPDKINYIEEEIFNPSGMTVIATYDNGKSYAVTPTVSDPVIALGQTTVTLTYSENGQTVTTTQAITSRKRLPAKLVITSPPDKVSYVEDESFNPVGIAFIVRYDNAKEVTVTPTYTDIPLVYGQTEIVFSYRESDITVTVAQPITVRRKIPSALIVTKQPDITAYTAGLKFKPAGMVVEVDYSGTKAVTAGYTFPDVRLTQGQGYVRLSYTEQGKTVTADVPISVGAQAAVYKKHTCNSTSCSPCSGSGQVTATVKCNNCDGKGKYPICGSHSSVVSNCEVRSYRCSSGHPAGQYGSICRQTISFGPPPDYTPVICEATKTSPVWSACRTGSCSSCGGKGSTTGKVSCTTCTGAGENYSIGTYVANVEGEYSKIPSNGRHSDGYWYVFVRLIQD